MKQANTTFSQESYYGQHHHQLQHQILVAHHEDLPCPNPSVLPAPLHMSNLDLGDLLQNPPVHIKPSPEFWDLHNSLSHAVENKYASRP